MIGNCQKFLNNSLVLLLFFSLSSTQVYGQNFRQEKRIYALDVTGSMWGFGDNVNIFNEVKKKLIENINSISDPSTEITVLTFGKEVIERWTYFSEDNSKPELIKRIQNLSFEETNDRQLGTNIEFAIEGMIEQIDPSKINYLILMTDGSHNTPNTNLDGVCQAINKICRKKEEAEIVLHPFYNMLTNQANTKALVNCLSCFDQVEGPLPVYVFLRPIKNEIAIDLYSGILSSSFTIVTNIKDVLDDQVKLKLTLEGNPNFTLKEKEFILGNRLGELPIELIPRRSLLEIRRNMQDDSRLKLKIEILSNNYENGISYFFKPETLGIRIYNRPIKSVSISLIEKG